MTPELRAEMVKVLMRMALISYGDVQRLGGRRGGEGDRIGPPGELVPMHSAWAERFERASEDELPAVLEQARAELDGWLRRPFAPDTTESWDELAARIVTDGWGVTADECALAMRCTPSMVRRARMAAGRHPESGYGLPAVNGDPMAWARALDDAGLSVRQIAGLTGVPKSTLHDRLR